MSKLDPRRLSSITRSLAWHLLATAFVFLVPSVALLGVPPWSRSPQELVALSALAAAYLGSVFILSVRFGRFDKVRVADIAVTVLAVFGAVFLLLLLARFSYSRRLLLAAFLIAGFLAIVFFVTQRVRGVAAAGMVAVIVLAFARSFGAQAREESGVVLERYIPTAFYDLRVSTYRNFIRQSKRAGGITRIGDRFLAATAEGLLYLFWWDSQSDSLKVRELPYRVPINLDAFVADGGDYPERFRVADVLAQTVGDHVRVFASHHVWKSDARCFVARVSVLEGSREALLAGDGSPMWQKLYETSPCLPVDADHFFGGHAIGGRLFQLDERRLLLTVGDQAFDGWSIKTALPQDEAAAYGKVIVIDLESGVGEVFSLGHRNPQGLYVDPGGSIWSTEHGPQGGDELNLIVRGTDYGWPRVTYGTHYGTFSWPLSEHQGEHRGFERPVYSWVPSSGVSHLIGVEQSLFPLWRGDLLIASLGDGVGLRRVRVREGRVIYVEPIRVGGRIRDLVEDEDGRIVLWTDRGDIVRVEPAGEEFRFAACMGCHVIGTGGNHGIGPDLRRVVGRRIASRKGFTYSNGLQKLGGEWTVERLNRFLEDPQAFAPGTSMRTEGIADSAARAAVIDYLRAPR